MSYYKAKLKNAVWCEYHGLVKIPTNFKDYDLGLSFTVDCPSCAFDMCDIPIEELEPLEYHENQYDDIEYFSDDSIWLGRRK